MRVVARALFYVVAWRRRCGSEGAGVDSEACCGTLPSCTLSWIKWNSLIFHLSTLFVHSYNPSVYPERLRRLIDTC